MVAVWEKGSACKKDIYRFQQDFTNFVLVDESLRTHSTRIFDGLGTLIRRINKDRNSGKSFSDLLGSTKTVNHGHTYI